MEDPTAEEPDLALADPGDSAEPSLADVAARIGYASIKSERL
jgi:hypothetical protein